MLLLLLLLLLLALTDAEEDILRLDAWLVLGRRNIGEWSDQTRRTGLYLGVWIRVEGELGLN